MVAKETNHRSIEGGNEWARKATRTASRPLISHGKGPDHPVQSGVDIATPPQPQTSCVSVCVSFLGQICRRCLAGASRAPKDKQDTVRYAVQFHEVRFRSFGATTKFTRAWEPTLLWNHYAQVVNESNRLFSSTIIGRVSIRRLAATAQQHDLGFSRRGNITSKLLIHGLVFMTIYAHGGLHQLREKQFQVSVGVIPAM